VTYKLVQLAAGSYDVEYAGEIVASLVQPPSRHVWIAELLDERGEYPPPFTGPEHRFDKLADALRWLGEPEVVTIPHVEALKRKRL
jgi:hypothetical protein